MKEKSLVAMMALSFAIWLMMFAGIVYAVAHFVQKFW